MTLQAYQLNTTYQKTQLQYDATITPVTKQEIQNNSRNDDSEQINTNAPVIYTNAENLTSPQRFQKLLLENILGRFNQKSSPQSLFPNENIDVNKESYEKGNPYTQNANTLPQGFLYESSNEYYEKTSFEFNFEATIKTPSGEYNIEMNFSYTHEFYERNETQIAIINDDFKNNQLEIEFNEDYENLKDLKSLHFIFDIYNEPKKYDKRDIFEEIRELLVQRREAFLEMLKEDKNDQNEKTIKRLDNFQIWQESSNNEISLVLAQKDGIGVFLANSNSESNFINLNVNPNGYSLEASYKSSTTNISQITDEMIY